MRTFFLVALLSCTALGAQTFRLERQGGAIGSPLRLELSGTPNRAFLLIPSLTAGPTPLSILDPSDTRRLEVGLDLLAFLQTGALGNSKTTIPFPIPNAPSLAGTTLHFHGFLFPGSTRFAGTLSNPMRQRLGVRNDWLSIGRVLVSKIALPVTVQLDDGRAFLIGGGSGTLLGAKGVRTTHFWDQNRQRFVRGPDLIAERALHGAVKLKNGKVLVIGGVNQQGATLSSCEIFDPKTGRFSATGSMSARRAGHTAHLLPNGKVLVTGGTTSLQDVSKAIFGTLRTTELYDPATGRWSGGARMSRPRLGHMGVELKDGRILVSGGATFSFIFPSVTNTAELYTASSNRWGGTGSMPVGVAAHVLTRLDDGRVLQTGGARLSGLTNITTTNVASIYSGGRWTRLANLAQSRAVHGSIVLPDGRALLIGGAQGEPDGRRDRSATV